MEKLNTVSYPPSVGRFNDQQLQGRCEWNGYGDEDNVTAALYTIAQEGKSGTTVTYVNPLDPGNADTQGEWLDVPHDGGRVVPAGRRY